MPKQSHLLYESDCGHVPEIHVMEQFLVERWYIFLDKKIGPPGRPIFGPKILATGASAKQNCNSSFFLHKNQATRWTNFLAEKIIPSLHKKIFCGLSFLALICSPTRRASVIISACNQNKMSASSRSRTRVWGIVRAQPCPPPGPLQFCVLPCGHKKVTIFQALW